MWLLLEIVYSDSIKIKGIQKPMSIVGFLNGVIQYQKALHASAL